MTMIAGTIKTDGLIQTISGTTKEGLALSFDREISTGIMWNFDVKPDARFEQDGAYRLLTEQGGAGLRYVNMADATTGERFVNDLAQTVQARTRGELSDSMNKRIGGTLVVAGMWSSSEEMTKQNLIAGSFALARISSFNEDGSFNHDKFEERANALKGIFWAQNQGAVRSLPDTPESVAKGYIEPTAEKLFNGMIEDFKKTESAGMERVQRFNEQMENYERLKKGQEGSK